MIRYIIKGALFVPADQITPHPENANNGDVDEIRESLATNGCYRAITVSSRTRRIVAGHHLYAALLAEGETEVPVSYLDNLSENDERRLLAVDNRTAAKAWVDNGLMLEMLNRIAEEDPTLAGTGYNIEDYADMLREEEHHYGGAQDGEDIMDSISENHQCPNCGHEFSTERVV